MGSLFSSTEQYTKLEQLGSGAFGTVYKAKTVDGQIVAVKEIKANGQQAQQIQREIKAHKQLPRHPNVVRFIEWFKGDDTTCLVLEYCNLGNLNDFVVCERPSKMIKVEMILDVARGINHLHQHNIVHRDIKPDNMLLMLDAGRNLVCKISDLGLSRLCTPSEALPTFYLTSGKGCLPYIAPEIFSSHYTKNCDVFSFGIVILVMFTLQYDTSGNLCPSINGQFPYQAAMSHQILPAIASSSLRPSLKEMLRNMLQTDYHLRMDMKAIIGSLQSIRHEIFSERQRLAY